LYCIPLTAENAEDAEEKLDPNQTAKTPSETRIGIDPAISAEAGMISGDFADYWRLSLSCLEFLGVLAVR
jgi:hypothetical protein